MIPRIFCHPEVWNYKSRRRKKCKQHTYVEVKWYVTNNQWSIEETKRNEKIPGDKENENTATQNLWKTTEAALRGKSQIHNLICLVGQSCPNLCNPMEPVRLLCLWGFSRQEYWSGLPCPPPGDLPNPGIEPRSPTLQVDSLLPEPQGKPKNIGVGSLSLLQRIFPTQELNWGLLHCRQILYQLSYQGSPDSFSLSHNLNLQLKELEK